MAQQKKLNHTEKNTSLTPAQTQIGETVRDGIYKQNELLLEVIKEIRELKSIDHKEKNIVKNGEDLWNFVTNPFYTSCYLFFAIIAYFILGYLELRTAKNRYPTSFKSVRFRSTPHDWLLTMFKKNFLRIVCFFRLNKLATIIFFPLIKIHNFIENCLMLFLQKIIFNILNIILKCLDMPPRKIVKKPKVLHVEVKPIYCAKYMMPSDMKYLLCNLVWSLFFGFSIMALVVLYIVLSENHMFEPKNFNMFTVFIFFSMFIALFSSQIFHWMNKYTYLNKNYNIPYLSFICIIRLFILIFILAVPLFAAKHYFSGELLEFIEITKNPVFWVSAIIGILTTTIQAIRLLKR